jgi:hypothetical protein
MARAMTAAKKLRTPADVAAALLVGMLAGIWVVGIVGASGTISLSP